MGIKAELNFASDFRVSQASFAFKLPFTDRVLRLTSQLYKDPDAWTSGIGSMCMDGLHVNLFDYDGVSFRQVAQDIKRIVFKEELPHALFFGMDRIDSFHVAILSKHTFSEAFRIQKTSNSDVGHQSSGKKVRGHEWLLREDIKGSRERPKYLGYLKSPFDYYEISSSHKKFIEMLYPDVPRLKYKREDNCKMEDIPIIDYNTGNRTDKDPEEFVKAKK